jgi:hypothetical protein
MVMESERIKMPKRGGIGLILNFLAIIKSYGKPN